MQPLWAHFSQRRIKPSYSMVWDLIYTGFLFPRKRSFPVFLSTQATYISCQALTNMYKNHIIITSLLDMMMLMEKIHYNDISQHTMKKKKKKRNTPPKQD